MSKKLKKCCIDLYLEVQEDVTFSLMGVVPFVGTPLDEPKVYVLDDGGHGGIFAINYCPFCGKLIELE